MFPYTSLQFEPGSRYSYSNPAILLLGRIIEILSGDPYQVYVHKNIFMPLGMTRSYFDTTPYHLIEDRSNNYSVVDGHPRPNGLDFDTGITVSNSGLNAPIGDMGRYVAFLMGGDPAKQALYGSLLERRSLEEMFEPHLPMTDPVAVDENSPQQHIGLTFFVIDRDGGRLIGHTGSQQAFRAFLYVDPIARTAVVAAFNSAAAGQDESRKPNAERVMATIRERVFRELFTRFRPPA